MFPLTSENDKKSIRKNIFMSALFVLITLVGIALVVFYFFPEILVEIFSGRIVTESIVILFYLGVAIGIMSVANLVLLYKLSVGKIRGYYMLGIPIVIEILLLLYFSSSLINFSFALIIASIIFLLGSIFLGQENGTQQSL